MKKLLYFIFIFIAYTISLWTFSMIPGIIMETGIASLLVLLVFFSVASAIVVTEINAVMKKGYRIHEFMTKVGRTPAISMILLSFLFIVAAIVAHYTGVALSGILGIKIVGAGIIAALLALGLLLIARSRSLDLIVIFSVILLIITVSVPMFLKSKFDEVVTSDTSRQFTEIALSRMFSLSSFHLTSDLIVMSFLVAILVFGLGIGFYYVIGFSMSSVKVSAKKLILIILAIQVLLSFTTALTMTYSLSIAHQAYSTAFQFGEAEESIRLYTEYFMPLWEFNITRVTTAVDATYGIPSILRIGGLTTYAVALSLALFLAGFTTLLVLFETGAQIAMDTFQTTRRNALIVVALISAVLAGFTYSDSIRGVLLSTIAGLIPIYTAIELFPASRAEESPGKIYVLMALLIGLGLVTVGLTIGVNGDVGILGIIVGLMLLVPLVFNKMLIKTAR
ncbi:hypothetical protein A3L04_06970 [Thermococcus chitonophagus]|uniref:Uncharacterized protein n=1 Tax=Thermococcus chitonophagus TaxID=54262 RepID=A0A170SPF6_9EURY|nr:sodium-dependent transporter [Thermococcus chitonophagus]ASJ16834.1 hypothetical protein A3L04_06970 [Thermococcus chitonophagus]CUX78308.1 hypothetical protein CHITON_1529 [Thermococcus chitonophagus]